MSDTASNAALVDALEAKPRREGVATTLDGPTTSRRDDAADDDDDAHAIVGTAADGKGEARDAWTSHRRRRARIAARCRWAITARRLRDPPGYADIAATRDEAVFRHTTRCLEMDSSFLS